MPEQALDGYPEGQGNDGEREAFIEGYKEFREEIGLEDA